MKRKFRPLLPAEASGPAPSQASPQTALTKRTQVPIACEQYRKRKARCDGNRPSCWPCLSRHAACVYPSSHPEALRKAHAELSQEKAEYEGIYKFIQTRPQAEADEIVLRIRAGVDAGSLLRFIEDGDLLAQAVLKPNSRRRRYEFPYHSGMPAYIFRSNNPYLDSFLFHSTFSQPIAGDSEHQVLNNSASDQQMHTTSKQPATDAINDDIIGTMVPEDLQLVRTHTAAARIKEDDEELLAKQSNSMWPVPGITGIYADPDKARLGVLVKTLEDVGLQQSDCETPKDDAT